MISRCSISQSIASYVLAIFKSMARGGFWGQAPASAARTAAPATLGAQRSIIGMPPGYASPIPAGCGSRPQLTKWPVILCSAIDRFLNLKKYHRPLISKGFLIAF